MRATSRGGGSASLRAGTIRELAIALAIAWLLVILRNAVFVIYPQSFFDSDQAIFALMAKHLAEGRAFPLFYYGQTYMLAVDAWVGAPFFWIMGPTVAAFHVSMVAVNLAAATLLIATLWQSCGLRPLLGLVASLPFVFAPPLTSAALLEAGANIAPLLYVLMLWRLCDRPIWFGFVLAIGFMHREFTAYAVPTLLVLQAWDGSLWTMGRVRTWLLAGASGLATWQFIQGLKPYADMMGPGTRGQLIGGVAGSQIGNLADRAHIDAGELPKRVVAMFTQELPHFLGVTHESVSIAAQGYNWLYWPLAIGLSVALARGAWLAWRSRGGARSGGTSAEAVAAAPARALSPAFAWYLIGVGAVAVAAYILTRSADAFVERYLLLALDLPIGVLALFFLTEPRAALRASILALMCVWTAASAADHWRQVRRYASGREPDHSQALADAIVASGTHVAIADYWRAYKLTFLARERVKIASSDFVRISEYQNLANAEGSKLLTLQQASCAGGRPVAGWYLCPQE